MSVAVSAGCSKGPVVIRPDEGHTDSGISMGFSIAAEDLGDTKAMIGSGTKDGFVSLAEACDQLDESGNSVEEDAVGIWAERIFLQPVTSSADVDSLTQFRYDIFTVDGNAAKLVSYKDGDDWKWKFESRDYYWNMGSRYNFLAYFPQTMDEYIHKAASASTPNTFVLTYSTHELQDDLMVAYNQVYTEDPAVNTKSTIYRSAADNTKVSRVNPKKKEVEGKGEKMYYGLTEEFSDLTAPIPLCFKHTLAAVKVKFQFDYVAEDQLIQCWFENEDDKGLSTIGMLIAGIGSLLDEEAPGVEEVTRENYPELNLTDAELAEFKKKTQQHYEKDCFRWEAHQTIHAGVPFYNWEVASGDGLPFSTTSADGISMTYNPAVAYTGGVNLTEASEKYTDNNGWVMILPQESGGAVKLRFRLKSAPNTVISLNIPAETGTDADGRNDPDGTYYVAGNMYTYTVTIKKTGAYVGVSVLDWNYLNSSTEIVF